MSINFNIDQLLGHNEASEQGKKGDDTTMTILPAFKQWQPMKQQSEANDAVVVVHHHTHPVSCGSITGDGKVAITGANYDKICLWDSVSGILLKQHTGHEGVVIYAGLSETEDYLATGDVTGIIQVWSMMDYTLVWNTKIVDATYMWWHNRLNIVFASCSKGDIYMWTIGNDEPKVFSGTGDRVTAALVTQDGERLVAGHAFGAIRIINLAEGTIQATIRPGIGHLDLVTSLVYDPSSKLIVSAGIDGKTIISSVETGSPVKVLQALQTKHQVLTKVARSLKSGTVDWVEEMAFCRSPDHQLLATGTTLGKIFIIDFSKKIICRSITQDCCASQVIWKGTSTKLFVGGFDGVVRCYDAITAQLIKSFCSNGPYILSMSMSKNGEKILITSVDSTARTFDISEC